MLDKNEIIQALQDEDCDSEDIPLEQLTPEICLAAVQKEANLLLKIPESLHTDKLYLATVSKDGLLLKKVPKDRRSLDICAAAVEQNPLAFPDVPEENRTLKLCHAVVQKKGVLLKNVPKAMHSVKLFLEAVEENGLALRYVVPEESRTFDVCLAAVRKDGLALKHVPNFLRQSIIQELSVASILAKNYASRQHFPQAPHLTESIKQFLASVEYLVVSYSPENYEEYDALLTYIHNKQEKNKIVCAIASNNSKVELYELLQDLSNAKNTKLHLVLLGQSNKYLGGLVVSDMVDVCEKNPSIQDVHLLGCLTAKAKQPAEEKEMLIKLHEKMQNHQYGLMTVVNASLTESFTEMCAKFCRNNDLDGVYLINKKNENTYELISIKFDTQTQKIISHKIRNIPEKHVSVQTVKNGGQHILFDHWEMSFNKKRPLPINSLSTHELSRIRSLIDTVERFEKTHPKYKKDKGMYPFLKKLEVLPEDLEDSLLKNLSDALRKSDKIKHNIRLHGVTRLLFVDTAQRNFKVANTNIYRSHYRSSSFYSKAPNINYEELKADRKK
jgi:hypothetical protein